MVVCPLGESAQGAAIYRVKFDDSDVFDLTHELVEPGGRDVFVGERVATDGGLCGDKTAPVIGETYERNEEESRVPREPVDRVIGPE